MNISASIHRHLSALLCSGILPLAAAEPPAEPMSLWFTSPANSYLESCPLGNGRLGAMDFGGVEDCRVVLNESSVWSGGFQFGRHLIVSSSRPDSQFPANLQGI